MLDELLIRRSRVRNPPGSYSRNRPTTHRTQASSYGTLYGTLDAEHRATVHSGEDDSAYFIARVGLAYAATEGLVAIFALIAIALGGAP